jgi:predicted nucleic acid-binding Zn ribbon protein
MSRLASSLLAAAVLALVAACSSSSSDPYAAIGGARACGGSARMASSCEVCILDACRAELQAASGTDPSRYGGACEAHDSCMCACARGGATSESECQRTCQETMTQDCARARAAALQCGFAAARAGAPCASACGR